MEQRICGAMIKQIHDHLEKDVNNTLRAQDLTMAQVGVLVAIHRTPEKKLQLKELERILHVAQSTVAGLVVRLEQKGFVECFIDAEDRRVKVVQITPTGEECCLRADDDMAKKEQTLLSPLSAAEQEAFLKLLDKICNPAGLYFWQFKSKLLKAS